MARVFDTPLITSDASIDRVLAANQPVLFVFLDEEAPPALAQTMKKLARQNAGNLLVVQTPVKDSPDAAQRYRLNRFPAVVTVRGGQVLSKAENAGSAEVEQHAAYLLGQGPRPQARPHPSSKSHQQTGHASTNGRPHTATDATFEEQVLRSPRPVLVDFWAPWCGPCRMVEPILEKLAHDLNGRLRVVKVNVDENPGIAQRYGVRSIPMMMIVKNGQITDRWAGALPEATLRSRVMPFLGG